MNCTEICQTTEKEMESIVEHLESQKYVNDILRKKLSKLGEREILHERKLRVIH